MYIPDHFREGDTGSLHRLMERYSFATLVTTGTQGLMASHIPFLLDAGAGPYGTLRAHLARANPQWRDLEQGTEALMIFQGPHAYVSPAWYVTGPAVPTWNYAAVHAYGRARLMADGPALEALLGELVRRHEADRATPWSLESQPAPFLQGMRRGIVGFEIAIERLEGKFKMSQNRPREDRQAVEAALRELAAEDPLGADVAAIMAAKG